MGARMIECDNQIPALLDFMSLRFSPPDGSGDDRYGGVEEMAQLQNEFGIFKKGRRLSHSINVLGLAGFASARVKNRWMKVLDDVVNGDEIVDRIIANLASQKPAPMFFRATSPKEKFVATIIQGRPLPFLDDNYIIVELPMKPRAKGPVA